MIDKNLYIAAHLVERPVQQIVTDQWIVCTMPWEEIRRSWLGRTVFRGLSKHLRGSR